MWMETYLPLANRNYLTPHPPSPPPIVHYLSPGPNSHPTTKFKTERILSTIWSSPSPPPLSLCLSLYPLSDNYVPLKLTGIVYTVPIAPPPPPSPPPPPPCRCVCVTRRQCLWTMCLKPALCACVSTYG